MRSVAPRLRPRHAAARRRRSAPPRSPASATTLPERGRRQRCRSPSASASTTSWIVQAHGHPLAPPRDAARAAAPTSPPRPASAARSRTPGSTPPSSTSCSSPPPRPTRSRPTPRRSSPTRSAPAAPARWTSAPPAPAFVTALSVGAAHDRGRPRRDRAGHRRRRALALHRLRRQAHRRPVRRRRRRDRPRATRTAAASARSCSAPTASSREAIIARRDDPVIRMDGHDDVQRAAAALVERHARRASSAPASTLDDVDLFVYHQANARITQRGRRAARAARRSASPTTSRDIGNTSAASIPLALALAARRRTGCTPATPCWWPPSAPASPGAARSSSGEAPHEPEAPT